MGYNFELYNNKGSLHRVVNGSHCFQTACGSTVEKVTGRFIEDDGTFTKCILCKEQELIDDMLDIVLTPITPQELVATEFENTRPFKDYDTLMTEVLMKTLIALGLRNYHTYFNGIEVRSRYTIRVSPAQPTTWEFWEGDTLKWRMHHSACDKGLFIVSIEKLFIETYALAFVDLQDTSENNRKRIDNGMSQVYQSTTVFVGTCTLDQVFWAIRTTGVLGGYSITKVNEL